VATATKIPVNLLAALENGERERLPERVFIMNYIRAYAQVIGLAEEEAVLRFEEIDRPARLKDLAANEPSRSKRRRLRVVLLIALLVTALYAALVRLGYLHLFRG
jgi:cytoskeletal protein RodZ